MSKPRLTPHPSHNFQTPSHAPPFSHPKFPRARPDILDPPHTLRSFHTSPLSANPSPCRKTLGFGPVRPDTRFETVNAPAAAGLCLHNSHANPYAVALRFVTQYNDPESGWVYAIPPESYIDKATGLTHIYARQIVGGIEVTNAHANLNISDGRVLSFGDPVRTLALSLHIMIRVNPTSSGSSRAYSTCRGPSAAFSSHRTLLHPPSATQSRIASHDHAKVREGLATLKHFHSSNRANVPSFGPSGQVDLDVDPRRPLLAFLASALPENHPELSSVVDNAEEHANKMDMTPETHLLGERLPNLAAFVPLEPNLDTVSSAPEKGRGHRSLAEAYAPAPKSPKLPKLSKATYEVFPWGVNDPVEAAQREAERDGLTEAEHPLSYGRKTVKELGDTLASPASWHTLPVSWDLSVGENDRAAMGDSFWRTTDTTWGVLRVQSKPPQTSLSPPW
ncbi:hypothetical protein PAXINDRAFT_21051 [Paxillus involutus ATCC 200175]|uniref:FTP domain-containing protein n=1 Tax=Paxillus involutus ATCC 200175 TaxID=664439 RepID=A0A0C9SM81_PAXIN|nr:hypothetical protein PAXINDRAFT_21051 [Paxillus involutus ATCC 200175]